MQHEYPYEFVARPPSSLMPDEHSGNDEEARRTSEALWESVERFALLSEASSVLLSAVDPVAAIQGIADKAMRHLDCDVFLSFIVNESDGVLALSGCAGVDDQVAEQIQVLRLNQSVSGLVASKGTQLICEDVQNSTDPREQVVRSLGVQAYAAIPLRTKHKTVGTLAFGSKSKKSFFEDEIMVMQTLAELFSSAIERANAEAELRATLRRTEVMERLASTVASSLDSAELADRVLLVFRQQLGADVGIVNLLDDPAGPATRVAHFGYLPNGQRQDDVPLDDSMMSGIAMLTGRIQVAIQEELPPTSRRWAESVGVDHHRFVVFPLGDPAHVIGVVRLGFPESRPFAESELDLFQAVGHQLSVGFERARLYDAQRDIAETLQETLVVLPTHVPGIAFSRAYESATYQSGRVGGDFIDVFEGHGPWVGIALGDVSGKGIEAAVTTSLIRNTLRVHALDGQPPALVASKTNVLMRRFGDVETFVTLWFGMLNTRTGQLRYVSAGHPPALLIPADDQIRLLGSGDPILGVIDDVRFTERQATLACGDRLVLYSDGVTESRSPDGAFLNEEGLLTLVSLFSRQSTSEMSESLMTCIMSLSEGVLRDDAAILVVEGTKLHNQQAAPAEERLFVD